jgi:hypothetical protein
MTADWEGPLEWLDSILTARLQVLQECYPSPTEAYDPLLLFAHVLGQATVIHLFDSTMQLESSLSDSNILQCQERALRAAGVVVQLARTMRELHFSKASHSAPGSMIR